MCCRDGQPRFVFSSQCACCCESATIAASCATDATIDAAATDADAQTVTLALTVMGRDTPVELPMKLLAPLVDLEGL